MPSYDFNKIKLVAKQEFNNVVKNKRFFYTTILAPVILALVFFLSGLIPYLNEKYENTEINKELNDTRVSVSASNSVSPSSSPVKKRNIYVLVVDSAGGYLAKAFQNASSPTDSLLFNYRKGDEPFIENSSDSVYSAVMNFPKNFYDKYEFSFLDNKNKTFDIIAGYVQSSAQIHIIKHIVKNKTGVDISNVYLPENYRIRIRHSQTQALIDQNAAEKQIQDKKWKEELEKQTQERKRKDAREGMQIWLSIILAISLYGFIYSSTDQLSFAVIEEKSNNLIDIIFTCIKPIDFISGKIIGIALIRFARLSLFILIPSLFLIILLIWNPAFIHDDNYFIGQVFLGLREIDNVFQIIMLYIFYFICGYLTYGALYAGFSSTIDKKGNPPALMSVLSVFIFIGYLISYTTYLAPNGPISVFFSICPLTAPFCMIARVPFNVATWQIILSMILTIATMLFSLKISSKVYTIGVQLYGEKISSKDLIRYLFNTNKF